MEQNTQKEESLIIEGNRREFDFVNKLVYGRYKILPDGVVIGRKGRPLILHPNKDGYVNVNLYNMGKQKTFLLHRLVAIFYLSNPNNLPEVNHIDGDKTNCHIDNLEWANRPSNIQHAFKTGLNKGAWFGKSGSKHHRSKAVYQCDALGYPIREYGSVREASKATGIHHNNIYDNIKKKLRSAGGFVWKYKE